MAPRAGSRHSFALGLRDEGARLFLSEREPYRYREHPDTRVHVVAQGDSLFDLAGRVYKNKPAPDNLVVPPHKYLSDTRIVIGEDSKGA